ncbi:MAG: ribonuclease E/G, partial [Clostridia bacterium]|nr:ribonuclease E/G [Clostridia bacterium]
MKKEWFLDRYCNQQFVALLEDGLLTEYAAESEPAGEVVGNIYKGKVVNVLAGIQAAFINCGMEKNCYLSTDETYADFSKYDSFLTVKDGGMSELKVGDEVIVQVVQPPRGSKGAKVTTRLSFVGKNLIYLPGTEFVGISRKITDEKVREEIVKATDKVRQNGEGVIVRTGAPSQTKKTLKKEFEYLKKLWLEVYKQAQTTQSGTLLYRDLDLPLRVIRDASGEEVEAIYVGDRELYDRIRSLAKLKGEFS